MRADLLVRRGVHIANDVVVGPHAEIREANDVRETVLGQVDRASGGIAEAQTAAPIVMGAQGLCRQGLAHGTHAVLRLQHTTICRDMLDAVGGVFAQRPPGSHDVGVALQRQVEREERKTTPI